MRRRLGVDLLRAIAVVLGVLALTFLLLRLAPGTPVLHLLGPNATAAQVAAATRALGLDQPLPLQFGRWLVRAVHGDFGISIATGRPVGAMLAAAWPATAILVGLSIILSQLIGIAIATVQATTRRPAVDGSLSLGTVALAALPGYWLAFVLVMVFAYTLRWLPAFGAAGLDADFLSPGARIADRLAHLALPLATLTLVGIGTAARYARGSLRAVRDEPYLLAARAKGTSRWRVLVRHHLRNGLIPVVALLGIALPALFSGAVFVEGVFAWPGVGQLLIQGVVARDYPVVMAASTVSSILVVGGSLLAERLLGRVDPRIAQ
jgi:peptide/nickel transport system permease protein